LSEYYDFIKEPRDLGMIKKNLNNDKYNSMGEFMNDLGLVFSNCKTYFDENSFMYAQAETLDNLLNFLVDDENILMRIENVEKLPATGTKPKIELA